MISKLDLIHQNQTVTNETGKEIEPFNPLEHNANIQQELWIQKQVCIFI